MAGPIDADDLIAVLEGLKKGDPYRKRRGLIERWVRNAGYDILILLVKHFPTMDAVPVVRCRECKHRYGKLCYMIAGGPHPIGTGDDYFCAYGERR